MYSQKVIRCFQNPKFTGEIKNADAVGKVGNVRCGDIMEVYLKVEDNVIKDIKFLTYGCIAAIAASEIMCKLAKGKTIDEALRIKAEDIVKGLGGKLPLIKVHCSVLGMKALKKAIENNQKRKEIKIRKNRK